jgi:predicted metal-dependent enzyme (double-stranded beta helix superfamily)
MTEQQSAFSIDQLVNDLKKAALREDARAQVKSILERTVKDPQWVGTSIPDYADDDVILFEDESVSIWHCRFQMGLSVPAHDHQLVATIAVYQGAERNVIWVNSDTDGIEQKTEILVKAGDVLQLAPNAIHSVSSAVDVDSCAIHVYLGKLTTVKRSLFETKKGIVLQFDDDNYQRLISADRA